MTRSLRSPPAPSKHAQLKCEIRWAKASRGVPDGMRMADLQSGWPVVGNDRRRVGAVREGDQNYILTLTIGLASDIYVPASAIANVEHEVVHLSVPQRDVASMGWGQSPRD